jgi:hypothetical protein
VRADVDVPLRKFNMTLLLKRNLDKSLPASHVVELTFHFAARLCRWRHRQRAGNTDEIQRNGARDRTGRALRQGGGRIFMVGLSDTAADRERNLQTLERAWFDIPIVYVDQRRAIARHRRD